jgi:hypothetical protein
VAPVPARGAVSTAPVRAALLLRISDDRWGDGAGVARQEADARALAARR